MRPLVRALPALLSAAALGLTAGSLSPGAPTSAVDQPAVPIVRATPTKIMPLGDSNTSGADEAGTAYRADLYQLLKADGRPIDFVGSNADGPAGLTDRDHEGHGGLNIDQISDEVVGWLNTYRPDVITLQIGTNDMYEDDTAQAAPGKLSKLLDTITTTLPEVKVFVTTIPQMDNVDWYSRVAAYNYTIPGIAAAKTAAGKHVTAVDANGGLFQPFDFLDDKHVEYGAASKDALRWYAALTNQQVTRFEAEQTANATLSGTTVQVAEVTSASGGKKVEGIDQADSTVKFSFEVGAAGNYRIRARNANGNGTTCTHKVSANGGTPVTISYPSYAWGWLGTSKVDLPLKVGKNTITFKKGVCSADLDAIDISLVPTA